MENRLFCNVKSIIIVSIFIFILPAFAISQVINDECRYAIPIPSTDDYCSQDAAFTNVGAKPDPSFPNTCVSLLWENGVWFSFTPKKPGVLIRVFGYGNGGSMRDPKIVLFEECGKYLECSPGSNTSTAEMLKTGLTPGHTYFIMVESSRNGNGTFRLCIDEFVPVPTPESDCVNAVVLCDKSSFKVESLTNSGKDNKEIEANSCIGEEFQSAWYKWTCDVSGTLTFTLTPNDYIDRNKVSDDLDFAVYELPGGLDDCANKKVLRCMASGANGINGVNNPLSTWIDCNGPTGLRLGEKDEIETAGCSRGDNNFLKELHMESGKSYVLIVNNFTREGRGFSIEFGGSGTFLGPEPDFEINANKAFECDKSVVITNNSKSATDPIVSYTWNFGNRSVPGSGSGLGPFDVIYQSFGDKIAALTVKTSRGCTVTKIKDIYVEPCCKDTSTLSLDGLLTDLRCYNIPEGSVLGQGVSGAPDYQYKIDDQPFGPNPLFSQLSAGKYTVYVQDIKGCTDSIDVIINQPEQIIVNAGPDFKLDLGSDTIVRISYTPVKPGDRVVWEPPLEQIDPFTYKAAPNVTTTYTVTVIDSSGCEASSQVTIRVEKNLHIHAPNIITPGNNDGFNDFFNVWASKGVKSIDLLEIYDRWGNLVYKGIDGENFHRNDRFSGWNGRINKHGDKADSGRAVVSGVYTWRVLARWLDDTTTNHAGDVTVLAPSDK
ncbi:MAG TPA: gliding motility-associated C-terminal domain-containing protein [Saprospiraceae bacterium]|nr:gliding motility-associated C-terminal domain-containing protein [Saprospiraceae bacterium]HRO09537.1 gliding motility-associated C-terminal domain-containing protein [Saprospiraceae bacterium]HRP42814.1 gliding motility-associated C-terminal domain-containing protein [Saprospiraceae bacterium]